MEICNANLGWSHCGIKKGPIQIAAIFSTFQETSFCWSENKLPYLLMLGM